MRNNYDSWGSAYALDRATGKLLWKTEDILGNLAYSPEKQLVYALRNDGNLLAIDEKDGKESIVARFAPVPFIFNIDGSAQAYQLAYDQEEHILMVSLGDSHQLFAFEEK